MATVTRRSGKYLVRVRLKGLPSVSRVFNDVKQARAWALETEDALQRGTFKIEEQALPTLGECLDRYWSEVSQNKRGADREAYVIGIWTRTPLASRPLDSITVRGLAGLRDAWLDEGKAPATVRNRFALLSHLFETARKDWYFAIPNPVKDLRLPTVRNQRKRTVSDHELEEVLAATGSQALQHLARLAIATAARLGELVAAEWKHVNLKTKTLHLPLTKNGDARTVPLSPAAVQVLDAMPRRLDGGRIFNITTSGVSQAWMRAVQRARERYVQVCDERGEEPGEYLLDLHFHDLRHTAITRLAEAGFQTLELAAVSGHKSLSMLHRYTHISPTHLAQKMAAI